MRYEFKQEDFVKIPTAMEGVKRSDWLPYVGIGGTVSYDRFFVDLYGLKTATGEQKNISQNTISSTPSLGAITEFNLQGNSDIERSDYSVSFGYNPFDNLVVFVGYKGSQTDFDNNFVFNASLNGQKLIEPTPVNIKQKLKQKGPFIGAAYGWNIIDKGILSVNLSVGSFNGEVEEKWNVPDLFSETVNLDGDVIGLTLGISWRGDITDNLGYTLSVSGYNYNFESNKDNAANFSESVFNFSAGLSYRF